MDSTSDMDQTPCRSRENLPQQTPVDFKTPRNVATPGVFKTPHDPVTPCVQEPATHTPLVCNTAPHNTNTKPCEFKTPVVLMAKMIPTKSAYVTDV